MKRKQNIVIPSVVKESLPIKQLRGKMTKAFLIFVLLFALCTLHLSKAHAAEVSLGTSPSILQIEATPPSDVRAPFSIENTSDEAVDLKIGYKLFKSSDKGDGQIEYVNNNHKIFDQVEVVDEDNFSIDSLSLGPRQKKNLILRVIIPKNEPFSDYYFSLIFLTEPKTTDSNPSTASPENNDELKLSLDDTSKDTATKSADKKNAAFSARAGIAINVLLSIWPQKTPPNASIEEFSTTLFRESGPVPFTLKIRNNGSKYVSPSGVIVIKNMFGQRIGRVDLKESNVLAGSSRSPALVWKDTLLLGFYTATINLVISDTGPTYTRSIHFVALPIKLFAGVTIAMIIITLTYLRVRKKMK